jgi:hypothetical protein
VGSITRLAIKNSPLKVRGNYQYVIFKHFFELNLGKGCAECGLYVIFKHFFELNLGKGALLSVKQSRGQEEKARELKALIVSN